MYRPWSQFLRPLAEWALDLAARQDVHGRYVPSPQRGEPTKIAFTDKSNLTKKVLLDHFSGEAVIGLFVINGRGTCRFAVIDIDRHDDRGSHEANERAAIALYDRAVGIGLSAFLEDSNGRGGYKLWLIFKEPVSARWVRRFAQWLIRDWKELGLEQEPEIFPKQVELESGKFGNFIRLPGRHHTLEHWSRIRGRGNWLEGEDAAREILATNGSTNEVIPAEFRAEPAAPPSPPAPRGTQRAIPPVAFTRMLRSALAAIPPSDYDQWSREGMCLRGLGDVGLELWEEASQKCPKYRPGACREKWGTFDPAGKLTYRTILGLARQNGWKRTPREEGQESENGNESRRQVSTTAEPKLTDSERSQGASPPAPCDNLPANSQPECTGQAKAEIVNGADGRGGGHPPASNGATPPPPKVPTLGPISGGKRPKIVWNNRQIHPVSNEALDALKSYNQPPWLFNLGGTLVRLRENESGARTEPLDEDSLRGILDRAALWVKESGSGKQPADDRKSAKQQAVTYPPKAIVRDVLSMGSWPKAALPPLRGIVGTPYVAEDGTLVDSPGYHGRSQMILVPDADLVVPAVPLSPTDDDIARARALLLDELLVDIPFKTPGDRASALAYLLTPLARNLFTGPTPLGLIEAPVMGTGKSLLAKCLAVPAVGKLSTSTQPENDGEWRKAITAKLVSSPVFVLYDNLSKKLESSALEEVLTTDFWSDRELGATRTIVVPVRCTWLATANNLQIKGDLHRRIVWIRLEVLMERPEERSASDFRHPDLLDWALKHRGELLWAALVLIRAWIARGKPPGPRGMGSYESWARTVGGILEAACIKGFLEEQKERRIDSDEIAGHWEAFLAEVYRRVADNDFGVNDLGWVADLEHPEFDEDQLPALLTDPDKGDRKKKLGWGLSRNEGRVYGRYQLVKAGKDSRSRACRYNVKKLEATRQAIVEWPGVDAEERKQSHSLIRGKAERDLSVKFWENIRSKSIKNVHVSDYGGQLWEAAHSLWLACQDNRLIRDMTLLRLAESTGYLPKLLPSNDEHGRLFDLHQRLDEINIALDGLMEIRPYDHLDHGGRAVLRYAILMQEDELESRAPASSLAEAVSPSPMQPPDDLAEYTSAGHYETFVELCRIWWLFENPVLITMRLLELVHEFSLLPGFCEFYDYERQHADLARILVSLQGVEFDGFVIQFEEIVSYRRTERGEPDYFFELRRLREFPTPAVAFNRHDPRIREQFRKEYRFTEKDVPHLCGLL